MELLDEYQREDQLREAHSLIRSCLANIKEVRRYRYSSHFDTKSIEKRISAIHNDMHLLECSTLPEYLHELSRTNHKLIDMSTTCSLKDYHIGECTLMFLFLGIIMTAIFNFSTDEDYLAFSSVGAGISFLITFFLCIGCYLDLQF